MLTKNFHTKVIAGALMALVTFSAAALDKQASRAKPKADLIVYTVENNFYADPTKIRIIIRNNGAVKSASAVALGVVNGTVKAEGTIPAIEPNYVYALTLKFGTAMKRGDRLKFVADYKKHVNESNENNNTKYSTY